MLGAILLQMHGTGKVDPAGVFGGWKFDRGLRSAAPRPADPSIELFLLRLKKEKHRVTGVEDAAHLVQRLAEDFTDILAHTHGEQRFEQMLKASPGTTEERGPLHSALY